MSRWFQQSDEDKTVQQALEGRLMAGRYECHTCGTYVNQGYYVSDSNTLQWQCENGHISKIKDFLHG